MINYDFLNLMKLTFQKFLGMCHYELLQTKNVPISRWLLHLLGKVKQVRIIRIVLSHLFRQIVAGIPDEKLKDCSKHCTTLVHLPELAWKKCK